MRNLSLIVWILISSKLAFAEIINNGSFENIGSDGKPVGWECYCQEPSQIQCHIQKAGHNSLNALVVPPNCTVGTYIKPNPAVNGFRFELYARGTQLNAHDFFIRGLAEGHTETAYASSLISSGAWTLIKSDAVSSVDSKRGAIATIQNSSTSDIIIDDVTGFQDVPNPQSKEGDIIKVRHRSLIQVSKNSDEIWFPLPLDYAAQTPLSVSLDLIPSNAATSIRYSQDKFGNWGAYIKFGNTFFGNVQVNWDALVLVRDIPDSEHAQVFAAVDDPNIWLSATPVSDSNFSGILAVAQSIKQNAQTSFEKIKKILLWLSQNVKFGYDGQGLDATHVFQHHLGTCTGYANLTSALGRAVGIPTRTIPNVFVGTSQETHYINEFYLGPKIGWWRVDPQNPFSPRANSDYGIVIRLGLPSDEGNDALNGTDWGAPGVPFWSLLQATGASVGLNSLNPNFFQGCPSCDNEAMHLVDMRTDFLKFKQSFGRARSYWQRDLTNYLNGSISQTSINKRKASEAIKDASDLDIFLDSIQ